ncbi:MAG: Fe-S protein assembly co-chaperone HscB [Alphaproteobacteria bacterium]|nr:Fe-S protein assembly co-chaperone HscB [Alphaproteobacteria bacterium]
MNRNVVDDRNVKALAGAVKACWSCRGPVDVRAMFCATCDALQGPTAVDHFERLELSRTFDIDLADLDRSYFRLQRLLHPDRFAAKSAPERAHSLAHSTALNRAYEILKDPLTCAEYLLTCLGAPLAGEDKTTADPVLLGEALERREALADATDALAVAALAAAAERDAEVCRATIGRAFTGNDLKAARAHTLRLRYLAKFLDDARVRQPRGAARRAASAHGATT